MPTLGEGSFPGTAFPSPPVFAPPIEKHTLRMAPKQLWKQFDDGATQTARDLPCRQPARFQSRCRTRRPQALGKDPSRAARIQLVGLERTGSFRSNPFSAVQSAALQHQRNANRQHCLVGAATMWKMLRQRFWYKGVVKGTQWPWQSAS